MQNLSAAATTQVPVSPHIFLMGRPPMGEAIGYLQTQTLEGQALDVSELADQWRVAQARVQELAVSEAGAADNPAIAELPPGLKALGQAVLNDPVTKQSHGIAPTEIKMVELDSLVVFQKQINLAYSAQLQAVLGHEPSEEDLLRFALPTDGRYDPATNAAPIQFGPVGPLLWAGVSPSMDYRVLKTDMIDPAQVSGFNANGRATHIIVAAIGYGSNLLSAMRVGSRLILKNGSHRAHSLRAGGHTHAPMLIQDIAPGEENELLPPIVQQQRDLYVTQPRPPMLKDYFDNDLHVVVNVPRQTRQLRVQFGYEEGAGPA
jgi:hypothetical protein